MRQDWRASPRAEAQISTSHTHSPALLRSCQHRNQPAHQPSQRQGTQQRPPPAGLLPAEADLLEPQRGTCTLQRGAVGKGQGAREKEQKAS